MGNKKKKRKHLTKNELLYHIKGMARMEKYAYGVAYRDSAVLINYILYQEFNFRQKLITDFNTRIIERYVNDKSQEECNIRLHEKAGFYVGYHFVNRKDIEKTGNKFVDSQRLKMIDVDNEIQGEFEKYTRYTYDSLIDMGFGKIRLLRMRGFIDNYSKEIKTEDIENQVNFLFEKIGLIIDLPDGFAN